MIAIIVTRHLVVATHDPRCRPELGAKICIDLEQRTGETVALKCVENSAEEGRLHAPASVTWLKNGERYTPDGTRVYVDNGDLVFSRVLLEDEASWECSNGTGPGDISPYFVLFGK